MACLVVCFRGAAPEPATAAHPRAPRRRPSRRLAVDPLALPRRLPRAMDVQGEPADPGGGLGPPAVRRALRLPGRRGEPAQPQEG